MLYIDGTATKKLLRCGEGCGNINHITVDTSQLKETLLSFEREKKARSND